jgi:hypothetical protein
MVFLNGSLAGDIYMEAPEGYSFEGNVLRMKKALYWLMLHGSHCQMAGMFDCHLARVSIT